MTTNLAGRISDSEEDAIAERDCEGENAGGAKYNVAGLVVE
jgi:hypothetical protein